MVPPPSQSASLKSSDTCRQVLGPKLRVFALNPKLKVSAPNPKPQTPSPKPQTPSSRYLPVARWCTVCSCGGQKKKEIKGHGCRPARLIFPPGLDLNSIQFNSGFMCPM